MTEHHRGGLPPIEGSRAVSRDVDRRRQVIAGASIAGFVALVLLVWVVVVAGGDGTDTARDDGVSTLGSADDPGGQAPAPTDGDDAERDTPGDAGDDPVRTDPGEPSEEEINDGDTTDDDGPDDDDTTDEEMTTLDFDGACTVEVPADEADADPRPWDHDECVHAPVSIEPGGERWVVVRASLPAGEFDAAAATRRAQAIGDDTRLLWSTHYPSLNPGYWVAFEGPYPDADAASDAATSIGGGAYPRALSER